MAQNNVHDGHRLNLEAGGTRTSGTPVVESGFHGIPQTDAVAGQFYALDVHGVKTIPTIASAAVGDTVHIHETTFALTRTAKAAAGVTGTRPFARVVAIPGDDPGPPSGFLNVLILPQTA